MRSAGALRFATRAGVLLAAVLTLALTGCSDDGGPPPAVAFGGNDINPKPREAVRDGGELRWPIDTLPGTTSKTAPGRRVLGHL